MIKKPRWFSLSFNHQVGISNKTNIRFFHKILTLRCLLRIYVFMLVDIFTSILLIDQLNSISSLTRITFICTQTTFSNKHVFFHLVVQFVGEICPSIMSLMSRVMSVWEEDRNKFKIVCDISRRTVTSYWHFAVSK